MRTALLPSEPTRGSNRSRVRGIRSHLLISGREVEVEVEVEVGSDDNDNDDDEEEEEEEGARAE